MTDTTKGSTKDVTDNLQDPLTELQDGLKETLRAGADKLTDEYGDALQTVRGIAGRNPAAALAVIAGTCFLLGALWSRRR